MLENDLNEELNQEPDLVEMTDDEGNTIVMQVLDYFFYNGDEYVILTDDVPEEGNTAEIPEEIDCYVMRVETSTDDSGEEIEEFLPVEDAALEEKLIEIASTRMNEDDEAE